MVALMKRFSGQDLIILSGLVMSDNGGVPLRTIGQKLSPNIE